METTLQLHISPQPDDSSCGPTCLHAVYRFYGDDIPLERVIAEVPNLESGGTMAVFLARHALSRGYEATIYTYNLQTFDPTWFDERPRRIADRLRQQIEARRDPKVRLASEAFLDFLRLGGDLRFEDLRPSLIRRHLVKGQPILTGLSATYLYRCAREAEDDRYDAIRGKPAGHFVVLAGYDRELRRVLLADPLQDNPLTQVHHYTVAIERVIGAIFLGIVTYDANLLVIEPKAARGASRRGGVDAGRGGRTE